MSTFNAFSMMKILTSYKPTNLCRGEGSRGGAPCIGSSEAGHRLVVCMLLVTEIEGDENGSPPAPEDRFIYPIHVGEL